MIVNGDEELITVILTQSRRGVIPCKPSSPSVDLILEHEGTEVSFIVVIVRLFCCCFYVVPCVVQVDVSLGLWSFDPREGFVTEEAQLDMASFDYSCRARLPSVADEQMTAFVVQVQRTVVCFYFIPFALLLPFAFSFSLGLKK